jgi:hypothetical protein
MSEKLTKQQFEDWAKKHGWLCYEEVANANGRQFDFITPQGNVVAVVIDLEGHLKALVPIPPMPVQFQGGPDIGKLRLR